MCKIKEKDQTIITIGSPRQTWVIGSIHADIDKLVSLHDDLLTRFAPGDRIVYTGNYIGYGFAPRQTLEELLTFRRLVLSIPGVFPDDITYLRGAQEEILDKLLQLPFASDPENIYLWMLGNGLSATLEGFDLDRHDGLFAAREGVMGLCRWTGQIRNNLRKISGYEHFMSGLKRAAVTDERIPGPMLFVNAGIDFNKPLLSQSYNFWWPTYKFAAMNSAYDPYKKVIRGYDPDHEGISVNGVTATIDGGCGFGGTLACAAFDRGSELVDLFEA